MLRPLRNLFARYFQDRRDRDWIACLDFGTAYSKFAMVRAEAVDDLEADDIRPLVVGDVTTAGGFLLESCVFVGEGTILFGRAAHDASLAGERSGREALQAPKQYLSTRPLEELDHPLSLGIDPSGAYTARKLITLYLAHMLYRARSSAREFSLPWPVPLRIARPGWAAAQAVQGEALLKAMVRDALLLLEALEDALDQEAGLPHQLAQDALAAIHSDAAPPEWEKVVFALDARGDASVNEATAVGAATIRPGGQRVVVVADIGGGTSDFGAFMTGLPGRNVVAELEGGSRILCRAGDHLDMLLRKFVLDSLGYLEDDPAAAGVNSRLRRRQRAYKETLFNERAVLIELPEEIVEVDLEAFLAYPPVVKFAQALRAEFEKALDIGIVAARDYVPGSRLAVEILRTGGGRELPMVQDLEDSPGRDWRFAAAASDIPAILEDDDLRKIFPQHAVAIGGALRDLPVRTAPVQV